MNKFHGLIIGVQQIILKKIKSGIPTILGCWRFTKLCCWFAGEYVKNSVEADEMS